MNRAAPSVLFYAELSRPFVPPDIRTRAMGGSETALLWVARGLVAFGHRVVVVGHPGSREGTYDGVEYVNVSSSSWRGREDIDVTVVFRQLPHVWRRLPGRVRLFWAHDHIGVYPEMRASPKRSLLTGAWSLGHRLFGRKVHGIVAVSHWLRDCYVTFAKWPAERVWVIPNGVNPDLFESGTVNPATGGIRPFRVAYTSVPERGLRLLIERIMPAIWREIPEVELHVFSYRPLDAFRSIAQAADARVRFRGGLPQWELARELSSFDLWLYPTDFPETSCIAAMEAQAAGVPVITSARYALQETVDNGRTGILVAGPVGSDVYVAHFVEAAVRLLRDPQARRAMGERARQRILAEFTWSRVAERWSRLLHQVAGIVGVTSR